MKYTAEELNLRYESLYSKHLSRIEKMRQWDLLYTGDHYNAALSWGAQAQGEERYVSNTPMNVVDIAHAVLFSTPLKITVRGERDTKKTQADSSEIEQFIQGALYANTLRYNSDPLRDAAFDALRLGWGVLFSGWDVGVAERNADETLPYQFPGVLKWVDPQYFYWADGGNRPYSSQCYAYPRSARSVSDEFGSSLLKRKSLLKRESTDRKGNVSADLADSDDVETFIDLWWFDGNKVMHAMVWGNTLILKPTPMSNYHDLPYTVAQCFSTTSRDFGSRSYPATHAIAYSVTMEERMINHMIRNIQMYGDPIMVKMEGIEADNAAGTILTIPRETGSVSNAIQYLKPPGIPGEIMNALGVFTRDTQQGSFGPYSYANVNPQSGVAGQLMTNNDRMRLNIPRSNFQLAFTIAVQKLLTTCGLAGESDKMYVFEQGKKTVALTGKKLQGWRVDCTMNIELPNDFVRDVNVAATIKNARLPYPDRMIQERLLRIDQPEEADKQLLLEEFLNMPEVKQMAMQMAVQEKAAELMDMLIATQQPTQPQPASLQPGQVPPQNMPSNPVPNPMELAGIPPQEVMGAMPPGLPEGVNPEMVRNMQ